MREAAYGSIATENESGALYNASWNVGLATTFAIGLANPCTYASAIGAGIRGLAALQAASGGMNAIEKFGKGEYLGAALEGLGAFASIAQLLKACFAAGTPLRTPDGSKPIEEFRVGDLILSRDENAPDAPVTVRRVEEIFTRSAFIRVLTIAGREIRTTAEHPFWVRDKGWTLAGTINAGDSVASESGGWLTVETVRDTGEFVQVHNLRVADDHTYFVGAVGWGFGVWAHNADGQTYQLIVSWATARSRYWTADAEKAIATGSRRYSLPNLELMLAGRAPRMLVMMRNRVDPQLVVLKDIALELHHRIFSQRSGSALRNEAWNLLPTSRWAHESLDEFRHAGWDLVKIIRGTNSLGL